MKLRTWLSMFGVLLLVALAFAPGGMGVALADKAFPNVINLPTGWQPEGIVTGHGPVIYSGSLATGGIYAADLKTGNGAILVPGEAGRAIVGLSFDKRTNYIYAAGGPTGSGYIFDAKTGAKVQEYSFTPPNTGFINDVIVTRNAAYFTNSFAAEFYVLPLGHGGKPAAPNNVKTIPLGGDWTQVDSFNANGIEVARDGRTLIIVNSTVGAIYRVNPRTGVAREIDLGGASAAGGDGLLLDKNTLYVVQGGANQVSVFKLNRNLTRARLTDTITDPGFDVPTTIAGFGHGLYVVNARFGIADAATASYTIVRVNEPKHDD